MTTEGAPQTVVEITRRPVFWDTGYGRGRWFKSSRARLHVDLMLSIECRFIIHDIADFLDRKKQFRIVALTVVGQEFQL